MACTLCPVSFAPPSTFSSSRKILSDWSPWWMMHSRSSSVNRLSIQTMAKTAIKCMSSNILSGGECTGNQEYGDALLKSGRHLSRSSSYIQTIISGYWVGPDAEDGWGYVVATVHQVAILYL